MVMSNGVHVARRSGTLGYHVLLRSETWHPNYHCSHLGFRNPDFPITFLGTLWTSSKKDLRPTPGLHWKYANWYQWHYCHNSHYEYVSMISGIIIIKETSSQTQKVKSTKDEPLVQSAKGVQLVILFLLPSFSDIIAHRGLYHGIALLEECKIWSWYCRNALHTVDCTIVNCNYIAVSTLRCSPAISGIWMFNAIMHWCISPPGQNREHHLFSQTLDLVLPLVWFPTLSFQMSISVDLSLRMKTLSGELPVGELVQRIPLFFHNYYFLG